LESDRFFDFPNRFALVLIAIASLSRDTWLLAFGLSRYRFALPRQVAFGPDIYRDWSLAIGFWVPGSSVDQEKIISVNL
jgi:hypothetical protein